MKTFIITYVEQAELKTRKIQATDRENAIEVMRKVAKDENLCFDAFRIKPGNTMKQIQSMPDIWDDTPFWVTRSAVIGAFAQAAVRQSPYLCPAFIVVGIRQFDAMFVSDDYFVTNCVDLRNLVREIFEKCPIVQGWNVPKEGKHTVVFCSRYSTPQPDYDFIDLDAMACNIAHSITLEAKYNQLHD